MAEPETKSDLSLQLYKARDTTGDVTIKAKTGSFKVHLCVLSARSPVFANMLSIDMQEGRDKVINLEHFDDAIVKTFIHFMYLNWTYGLQEDLTELLKFAHMYELKDLLVMCWRSILKSMSPNTVVDLLLLAEQYGDQDEKHKVSEYLLDNLYYVMKTESYFILIKDHSDLYLRICGTPIPDKEGGPCDKKVKAEFFFGDDPSASYLRIFARAFDESWTLNVKPTYSIQKVKGLIYDASGISPKRQRLVFKGIELDDNLDVYDYGIQNDASIHLLNCIRH